MAACATALFPIDVASTPFIATSELVADALAGALADAFAELLTRYLSSSGVMSIHCPLERCARLRRRRLRCARHNGSSMKSSETTR